MWQAVYDYPYLSSSANHVFDLTVGFSPNSVLSASSPTDTDNPQQVKKINMYNEMAQILVGFDVSGSIREFDADGDLTGGVKLKEVFFLNLARLLSKDEIKKESLSITLMTSGGMGMADGTAQSLTGKLTFQDTDALTNYKVNSPAGEYGILYNSADNTEKVGLVYYQAGIVVLSASIFNEAHSASADGSFNFGPYNKTFPGTEFGTVAMALTGAAISGSADGLRNRLVNISFNNTTELNSTIYFCRANNNEFNYSANPTYLSSSKLVVKSNQDDLPVSYITTIGLYSSDNELLATAKLSEPLKKTPNDEFVLRVRLDY
jgi:hypothetical protein